MPRPPLVDLLRHHSWATIRLIEFAKGLTMEQRGWTVPGTYGSIGETLAHIVGADRYYLFRLTGEWPPTERMRQEEIDLDDLVSGARVAAEMYETYVSEGPDPDEVRTHEGASGTRSETVGTILAQVVHHGNEHRAQIGTILGAHGVEPPSYSGWAWGR